MTLSLPPLQMAANAAVGGAGGGGAAAAAAVASGICDCLMSTICVFKPEAAAWLCSECDLPTEHSNEHIGKMCNVCEDIAAGFAMPGCADTAVKFKYYYYCVEHQRTCGICALCHVTLSVHWNNAFRPCGDYCRPCGKRHDISVCDVCDAPPACECGEDDDGRIVGCCNDGDCPKNIDVMCQECGTWDEKDAVWRCPDCQEAFETKAAALLAAQMELTRKAGKVAAREAAVEALRKEAEAEIAKMLAEAALN